MSQSKSTNTCNYPPERPFAPPTGSQIYVLCTKYFGPVEWTGNRDDAAAWEADLPGIRYVRKVDPHSANKLRQRCL